MKLSELFSIFLLVTIASLSVHSQEQSPQQYGPPSQEQQIQQKRRPIGADMESTLKIVAALCKPGVVTEDLVNKFFQCYSFVEGKEVYFKCQHDAFGCMLNTVNTINSVCQNLGKFQVYSTCLRTEFMKTKIDAIASGTKLNQCMAEVLGVV